VISRALAAAVSMVIVRVFIAVLQKLISSVSQWPRDAMVPWGASMRVVICAAACRRGQRARSASIRPRHADRLGCTRASARLCGFALSIRQRVHEIPGIASLRKTHFMSDFNLLPPSCGPCAKISLSFFRNLCFVQPVLARQERRIAIVMTRGAGCDGRDRSQRVFRARTNDMART
jgi:hypothetical protein